MKRLIVVTALMAEAVPLIDFYRLHKQPRRPGYHHYRGRSQPLDRLDLLVCGMGAERMAQALAAYLEVETPGAGSLWLNTGIAGALEYPLGELIWIDRIGEQAIAVPPETGVHANARLISLSRPGARYQSETLFDMEGQACLSSLQENCLEFAPEQLFCAKVVSDNPARSVDSVDRQWVTEALRKQLHALDVFIKKSIITIS